ADRMLDMGFLPDLKRIIRALPTRRQSLFFSATLPPKILDLAHGLLRNPVSVNVTPKNTNVERITQQVLFVEPKKKPAMLRQILTGQDVERAIVFTRTKRGANMLTAKLEQHGIPAAVIHGNKSQNARQRALEAFRTSEVRVLVATDVAARGIDIDCVTHVVNFDIPNEPESYVHRIGRTGRAGADGIAFSFCSQSEMQDLRAIEKLIGQKLEVSEIRPPSDSQERRESRDRSRAPVMTEQQPSQNQQEAGSRPRRRPRRTRRPAAAQMTHSEEARPGRTVAKAAGSRRRFRNGNASSGKRRADNRDR
ncbi:MAG: DEAD/DEAH box helicase, partial [Planctomycetaceae bacterium]|nr:DEAD/DEAH box helicase [Planctomycetaceae bacterium]